MPRTAPFAVALALLATAACAAPGAETQPPAAEPQGAALWQAGAAAPTLRSASCPPGAPSAQAFQPLQLTVSPLNAKQTEVLSSRLPAAARLAGAWELDAADPNFGGLSGLAAREDGSLLAITDAGGWVELGLEAGAPATARIAYMRGADGRFLRGKSENDAEGLAYRDGLAFVSFERDFRIEAFALGACGPNAKAVRVAALSTAFNGQTIDENAGPEALALTPEGHLRFGYEGAPDNGSPLGGVQEDGTADWSGSRAANPGGFALVGMDSVRRPDGSDREVFLYRAFDPLRGARSVLSWGPGEADQLTLSRPVLTDNFEGLAAGVQANGDLRLWIVSDDNFSDLQRTLLFAFDVSLPLDAE